MSDDRHHLKAMIFSRHLRLRKNERFGTALTQREIFEAIKDAKPAVTRSDGVREYQIKVRGRPCTVVVGPPDDRLRKAAAEGRGVFLDDDDDAVITVIDNISGERLL